MITYMNKHLKVRYFKNSIIPIFKYYIEFSALKMSSDRKSYSLYFFHSKNRPNLINSNVLIGFSYFR